MFENFNLDGIDYYRYEGKYYSDNCIIREEISFDFFRRKMIDFMIKNR